MDTAKSRIVKKKAGSNRFSVDNTQEHLAIEWERVLLGEGILLSTDDLIAALESPQLHIRAGAAIILGRRCEKSSIPYLKDLLEDEPMVSVEAAMSLFLMGNSTGIPVLISLLESDLISGAPITAASYLAVTGDPRGFRVTLAALQHKLAGIRLIAAVALRSFIPYQNEVIEGSKLDLFKIVQKMIKDPNPLVRRELARIQTKLNTTQSQKVLLTRKQPTKKAKTLNPAAPAEVKEHTNR